ncbi:TOPRIM nucleotidyl transferase/hydrolase domain-containing protein [Hafnia paralvei]
MKFRCLSLTPHLCESFFSDEVILVEGDTEAIITRQLLLEHFPEKEMICS